MSGPPKLKRADARDQDIQNERSGPDEIGGESAKGHYRDVTGSAGVADRGIEESDDGNSGDEQNQMRRVEVHRRFIAERLRRFKERRFLTADYFGRARLRRADRG
jgi:hypothetical protein